MLQDQIIGLIAAGVETNAPDRPGAIFVRPAEQISSEDRIAVPVGRQGDHHRQPRLAGGADRRPPGRSSLPARFTPDPGPPRAGSRRRRRRPAATWSFFNGLGGFTPDGHEYIITTGPGAVTPAPWVNVLANPGFGTVISESGSAYSWAENAHEFRLTPWNNDPVTDAGGEAFYLRDEESGRFWSPTPLPAGSDSPYTSRHGFGYSVFEHTEDGITSELWVYVDPTAPVKWSVLKIRNVSGRSRRLSVDRLRGVGPGRPPGEDRPARGHRDRSRTPARSSPRTRTTPSSPGARPSSTWTTRAAACLATAPSSSAATARSGSRPRCCGRRCPVAWEARWIRARRSRWPSRWRPARSARSSSALGAGRDRDDAAALLGRVRGAAAARRSLEAVWQYWSHTLGAVNVETPDAALNTLANGWLLYQTMACRLWGRSGFYQSGGAFGFRDQLQDVMALVHAEAPLVRQHLLLCASRQFPRRRRPALVASARRPGRPHALLGRLPLAADGRLPLRDGHRRHRRAR